MFKTFNAPPRLGDVDDSRNVSQWVQYTSEHSPEHPLFLYASPSSQQHVVTWSQFGAAVERAAYLIDSYFGISAAVERGSTPQIVGILANLDTITYHTLCLGILRTGGTAFLISSRNSPAAVSHLLKQTNAHKLLVSTDAQVQALVLSALALKDCAVVLRTAPLFQTLFESNETRFSLGGGLKSRIDAPAVILHSSGSTSFPKPLSMTHHTILQWARVTELVGAKLNNDRLAIHGLPVYHSMGFFALYWALRVGWTLTVFPPQSPPVVPSPANSLSSAVATHSTFVYCVPLFLEVWSRDTEAIFHLKKLRGIIFGGGPFNRAIGHELVQFGVPLIGLYGSTEIGPGCLLVARGPGDKDWEWMQLSSFTNAKFVPQEEDPNTFELVYLECATHCPLVFNTVIDGKAAFATSDIVIRHPTDPMKFKILGRKDDQITLSSGKKTNPAPIEAIICRNPFVEAALMFGRGRDQNGIIIQTTKEREFDPTDTSKLARFRNDVWPSIAEANQASPGHSRLFKEASVIQSMMRKNVVFDPRTDDIATLEAYKTEIDAAYRAVQASTQIDIPLPMVWDSTDVLVYVRKVVHNVMGKQVTDEADIFEQGGDSLHATYIRNSLVHAVRQTRKTATGHVSQNFVYENPTIVRLAGRLLFFVNAMPGARGDKVSLKLQDMEATVVEFSAQFPEHRPRNSLEIFSGEVVLLTGTTGGLGSQLLSNLALSTEVSHVYALNRSSSRNTLRNRQTEALRQRGLDASIIDSSRVTLVEGDTTTQGLGIDPVLYDEIRDRITLIIHNAWKVNFNLAFGSFKSNIKGVRTLIDLALGSPWREPPRIIFASTVGVFRHWDAEQGMPLEAPIEDSKLSLGNGYGESKFVGERILENAAKSTPLRPIIVRIGQLTGTSNGAWNPGDWLPAIVRSGQVLGALPARSDCIAWISLEAAAQAVFEFRYSESQHLHLAHPNPVPWNSVFEVFSSRLNVPLVDWGEWLDRLERSVGGKEKNPAVNLVGFFRGCAPMALKNREAPGIPLMDLTQALKSSPALANPSLPQISQRDAEGWLSGWKAVGFLSNDTGKL